MQISWGVRFDDQAGANAFLHKLAAELSLRLKDQGCKGKTITLSLKRQKPVRRLGSLISLQVVRSTGAHVPTHTVYSKVRHLRSSAAERQVQVHIRTRHVNAACFAQAAKALV
jgi:impB/mucB/samB family C-terminal domain